MPTAEMARGENREVMQFTTALRFGRSLLGFLIVGTACAQSDGAALVMPATEAAPVPSAIVSEPVAPRRFRGLYLGMSLSELKAGLAADKYFSFRGDADVSFLPVGEQYLVETTGPAFIRRAFFQLKDSVVFMMAFTLDPEKIDHYSVFTALTADYGEAAELTPKSAVWLSDATRVALERPLTVKYIDRAVFDGLLEASRAKEASAAVLRKEFLDAF